MANDRCGHPTQGGDGPPCENPATEGDSCWIKAHGGHVTGHGRPLLLYEYEDQILAGAAMGMTLEGCARLAGVDESTLHRWKNEHPDFNKALKRARAQGELKHLRNVEERGSQFILERSFGYVKTEKREVEADVTRREATHETDDYAVIPDDASIEAAEMEGEPASQE